ncbi:MAG: glycosyltransferase family 4 protein [Chloroflexi bacterium]|nr:glycosyltransferase family 4 protein [Chloroflexota bacterium]
MSRVRLLAVHQGGGVGGAPVSILKLLQRLDAQRFDVSAVFTESGPVLEFARELGVNASIVPSGGAFFYSAHARISVRMLARFVRTFPSAVRHARATLRALSPDLVHLNTSVLIAWAAAARREQVPLVWVVREVLGPDPRIRGWHAGFIATRARRVVAISNAVRESLEIDANVVYNAVDLAEFDLQLLPQTSTVRMQLGLPERARVLAVLGSVQPVKGHWLALRALQLLPSDVHLLLVGGGVSESYARSWRGRVKRMLGRPLDNLDLFLRDADALGLRRRIHVTGFTRDIPRVLAAADLVVFPSLEPEGFGRPIIEAMAMRRPVIATDVGPSRELLGLEAGCLVRPDVQQLASAVRHVLDSPELTARMGAAGRARVEECFTLDRQVHSMQKIYCEVAGG